MAVFRTRPMLVEALHWQPADMYAAGQTIATMTALGLNPQCVNGLGANAELQVNVPVDGPQGTVPLIMLPGNWLVIQPGEGYGLMSHETFQTMYEEVEPR